MKIGGAHEVGRTCLHREPHSPKENSYRRATLDMQIEGAHDLK